MARWECLTEEQYHAVWDEALARFEDCSPFQSYVWGEYRRALGWRPCRWMAFDERNACIAMMQGYVRRYPFGMGIVWSEGGPVGDLSAFDNTFHSAVRETTGLRAVYYRFRCDRGRHIEDALRLTSLGWTMPWAPLTTNYTMTIDVSVTEDVLLAGCERNWRRNLKRSTECNLNVHEWQQPSSEEIMDAYRSMESLKQLDEQQSADEINWMLRSLEQNLILYRCDDKDGRLLSVMGCLVSGEKACLVISATNGRGRELHASYAIFWALICHCRKAGVRMFDFAGIDPVRNPGVYRFKRAAGGRAVELLGEWDWASRPWLRWFGNWAIAKRNRIRAAETALKRSTKEAESPQMPNADSPRETPQGPSRVAESFISL
ncbi:MAG TPA: peptidoglycan bridge formation glycyltransferase FemA/FemB family protein [Pyrinomonadaceae bacterium]|nr:peptidoglycan bridge formation glycyltransferase FemA/FemB family protein [Pyrinomonadaceae bacterium]